ncbi:hypothetical protein TNCV_2041501 [Trichonephila clavipes]|nr:hypothetical protein TNCV_2041501 [Trichonephila clavipes]
MPDGTDKDQDSKINDSVHPTVLSSSQNHAMPVKNKCFPVEPSGYSPLVSMERKKKGIRTAADSVQSGWPVEYPIVSRQRNLRAQAQLSETRTKTLRNFNH